jgi:predicted phosphatase
MAMARDTTAAQYGQNTCGGTEKIVDLPDCKGCARNWCEFRRRGYLLSSLSWNMEVQVVQELSNTR